MVNVICCVALVPVPTLPKLTVFGLACNCPNDAVDPVPPNATLIVGLEGSLLVMDKVAAAAPPTFGWKDKAVCADWPAEIVFGVVNPLAPNSAPMTEMAEIVKSALPMFDTVKLVVPVEPTPIVPN